MCDTENSTASVSITGCKGGGGTSSIAEASCSGRRVVSQEGGGEGMPAMEAYWLVRRKEACLEAGGTASQKKGRLKMTRDGYA